MVNLREDDAALPLEEEALLLAELLRADVDVAAAPSIL